MHTDCIFCKIVSGEFESVKVWESDKFLAFKNKFPDAPIHILIVPKTHVEKSNLWTNSEENVKRNGELMNATYEVMKFLGLDKKGFRLVINGAGYNEIEHEHIHLLSEIPNKESNL